MPVKAVDLTAHKLMQFPTVIGGVESSSTFRASTRTSWKLTGPVLADIYLGKITKWNDEAITAINPGLKLPSTAIATVHRADGSGTSFVFTDYLSMQSAEWKSKVVALTMQESSERRWRQGQRDAASLVLCVRSRARHRVMDESAYAEQNHLTTAMLLNKERAMSPPRWLPSRHRRRVPIGRKEAAEFRHRPERPAG